ncbi:FAD-dependent oxidoreductase [Rhodoferax sp.]|uniref:flavin monoamine oxidase family protein n=1 Tax=Rhodoferax sp. TaxID=50421 RepID=UPI00260AB7E8|nr:FAD-dependent oxidoreductase [Rhodoferax sp.]MDD2926656.1 FAD-dependent oxidoreductase [Rhodoferax sp.]
MADPVPLPVTPVVDVAIVGAGLCGLALAHMLVAQGVSLRLIEARERLGGRILTQPCEATGQALDLGASWFWPETEPRITALLSELGLASHAQHDPGDALWLTDPNREPERRSEVGGIHVGARAVTGGAARIIHTLAESLPPGSVRTAAAVHLLRDRGEYIELICRTGPAIRARQVVLALPPRLIHQHIQFEPALPAAVWAALAATPTWMAAQAKSATTFAQPFWRMAGQSGNAFVRHAQAVLGEVFDASAPGLSTGALGGFVALNAAQRESFQRGLPLLISSQLTQLFGPAAQDGQAYLQDWALEPWTCSTLERSQPQAPPQNEPLLRQALWAGRLLLGGSETAAHGAGHMEGALESADRLQHALCRPSANRTLDAFDDTAIASFAICVQALRGLAPQRYRQHLTRLLASQQAELLTQRALLATVDQVYSEALVQLDVLLPVMNLPASEITKGRHALTASLLTAFDGWNKHLLEAALAHNASSCALSNFPTEHQPDADSLRAITLDLAAAWREFALELNARLLQAAGEIESTT